MSMCRAIKIMYQFLSMNEKIIVNYVQKYTVNSNAFKTYLEKE